MIREGKVRVALAAVAAALMLLFLAGLLLFNSQAFHRFLLAQIIAKAEASTGARVEIRQWGSAWRPFTANFYDVVVRGPGQAAQPALFEARHVGVSLGILALLRRQIDLYAIVVDRPVVRVYVDERGRSNIPKSSQASPSSFRLLVRHVVIADGLVHYNNESVPLSAELQNFRAQVAFDAHKNAYRGWLAYGDGWIAAKQYDPLRHAAHIDFEATQDALTVDSLVLSTPRSHFTVRATLTQFAKPSVQGSYAGVISTLDLARVLKNPSLPRGDLAVSGSLRYHYVPGQPFLRTAGLEGRLSSTGLALQTSQVTTSLKSIRGSYRLQDGDLRVDNLEADLLDGHLIAGLEILRLDRTPAWRASTVLRGISLENLSDAVPAESRKDMQLVGRASLEAQARWSGSISRIAAHAHLDVHSPPEQPARPSVVPVNGVVNVDYDGARETASFGQSSLRTGKTELRMSGILSRQSNLDISLSSSDLHQLAGLLGASLASPEIAAHDLQGAARITARISGRPADPLCSAQLSSSDLRIEGARLQSVRATVHARSSAFAIENGYVQSSDQGQISFYGQAQLAHWSFTPDRAISLHAKLAKLSLQSFERLAKLDYPLTGDLSGDISMEGSWQRPEGHGSLQLTRASAWNERIDSLTVDFRGGKDSVQSEVQLKLPAGAASAQLSYGLATKRYDVSLNTSHLALERLASFEQRGGPMRGLLTANLSGQGSLSDPQLTATVEIPQLQAGEQTISNLQAKAQVAHHHVDVALNSVIAQGYVQLKGGLDLRDGYNLDAALDVRALPLGPILARYLPGATEDLSGQTEIHASLKGPLKNPARLEARVEIPTLDLAYKTVQIANEGPLRLDYRNGAAIVQQARLKGTGTELTFEGVIPVRSSTPWDLAANGTVDASLLQVLYPDAHASGHLEIHCQRRGASSGRAFEGEVRLVDTSFSTDSLPVGFTGVNGQFSISGNRIEMTSLNGSAGGGTFTGAGFFAYGRQSSFAVDLHAQDVRASSNGLRTVVNSNLRLKGTPQNSLLSGDVLVDRLSFQPGADLAELMGQFSEPSAASRPSPFASHMRLNIAVRSAENLNPTSSQLSIEGTANLTLTGTAANPVVLGRVALTGGELFFNGKRLQIQSGSIAFVNPVHTEAVLNIYVKTVVEQYNITINFVGSPDRLRTTYTSDPALPPLDIISLLAFGQTTAERASNASTPLSVGAESALASQVSSQVAKNVQSLTGISRLTIDPLLVNNQNPGAQVAIEQRVTGSILLTFSTDVTSTQGQSIQVKYQPKGQWRISVLRDQNGGYGIDIGFHKAF